MKTKTSISFLVILLTAITLLPQSGTANPLNINTMSDKTLEINSESLVSTIAQICLNQLTDPENTPAVSTVTLTPIQLTTWNQLDDLLQGFASYSDATWTTTSAYQGGSCIIETKANYGDQTYESCTTVTLDGIQLKFVSGNECGF